MEEGRAVYKKGALPPVTKDNELSAFGFLAENLKNTLSKYPTTSQEDINYCKMIMWRIN